MPNTDRTMWATDLIKRLQHHVDVNGDMPVYVWDGHKSGWTLADTEIETLQNDGEGTIVGIHCGALIY